MAHLINKESITTSNIFEIFANDVPKFLDQSISENEYHSINSEFQFIGEFRSKRDIVLWYLEKDADFQNLPAKVLEIVLRDEQGVLTQMFDDFLIIDIEVKRLTGSNFYTTIYYLFEVVK